MNDRQRTKLLRKSPDPEERRWLQRFPRRPSIDQCLDVLSERNTRGLWIDLACWELEEHARETPQEVIDTVSRLDDPWLRLIMLGAIENAEIEEAIPLFAEILSRGTTEEQSYAIRGLRAINTKAARTILFEAGVS